MKQQHSKSSNKNEELNMIDLEPPIQIVILGEDDNPIKVSKEEDPPQKHLASSSNGQLKSNKMTVTPIEGNKSHDEVELGTFKTSINLGDAGGLPTTAEKVIKQKGIF